MAGPSLAPQLARAPVVFMDCDGVVFDANRFKLAALDRVLADFPQACRAPMLDYWKSSGGVSRYVKFDHLVRGILGLQGQTAELRAAQAIERFAQGSREGYRHVRPLEAALRLGRRLGPSRCVIISGTDQRELQDVFHSHRLTTTFATVLGSPQTKVEHIRHVLEARGASARDCFFIGDGAGDFRSAQQTGVPFIFLAQMSEWVGAADTMQGAPNVRRYETWDELLEAAEVSA